MEAERDQRDRQTVFPGYDVNRTRRPASHCHADRPSLPDTDVHHPAGSSLDLPYFTPSRSLPPLGRTSTWTFLSSFPSPSRSLGVRILSERSPRIHPAFKPRLSAYLLHSPLARAASFLSQRVLQPSFPCLTPLDPIHPVEPFDPRHPTFRSFPLSLSLRPPAAIRRANDSNYSRQ